MRERGAGWTFGKLADSLSYTSFRAIGISLLVSGWLPCSPVCFRWEALGKGLGGWDKEETERRTRPCRLSDLLDPRRPTFRARSSYIARPGAVRELNAHSPPANLPFRARFRRSATFKTPFLRSSSRRGTDSRIVYTAWLRFKKGFFRTRGSVLRTPCRHHDFRRERRVFGSLELELEAERPRPRLRSGVLGQERLETRVFVISGKAHLRFSSTSSWLVQCQRDRIGDGGHG